MMEPSSVLYDDDDNDISEANLKTTSMPGSSKLSYGGTWPANSVAQNKK